MTPTRLDVGARQTRLQVGSASLELALGAELTAAACFRHTPPTPQEIERAIDIVEGEVMPALASGPRHPALGAGGLALQQIAAAAGAPTLSLDEVEQMFQRVASEALGDPTARRGLPPGNGFVMTLLILREFMHHGGFSAVEFDAGDA